ncbi:S-adenosyl-L-methionine-dependent methyltransferase [Durotheca rogersii]|uniref:S-adenosyl-L-methionine-dependent methyltransferase n=1 Tax=Durotheca rogersii TaxID=419775 RepID=UPI00221F2567|nr:S-adenosyl-L-methionine-dependent methyltransferase [Durotheca rogersii]KAI5867257.1 S-adenosyl-L-methionine-dependent methyltransferase [Durotheca rogersii]
MPRLPPSLFRRARSISPHVATLLPACRDLDTARRELRWIREHACSVLSRSATLRARPPTAAHSSRSPRRRKPRGEQLGHRPGTGADGRGASRGKQQGEKRAELDRLVARLCRERGAGKPLQYVLGSQPFGPLEIACGPGVLIPRAETEAWTARVAAVVGEACAAGDALTVVDLCTGTGCVALLLHALLQRPGLRIRGVDVAPRAVALARRNLAAYAGAAATPPDVAFARADVFDPAAGLAALLPLPPPAAPDAWPRVDLLVANPPYIAPRDFARDTARAVRNWEPRLALVPPPVAGETWAGRAIYARLLDIAERTRARFALFEVGGAAQAHGVVRLARRRGDVEIEIWRDWPDAQPQDGEAQAVDVDGVALPVRGSGHIRSVFIRRDGAR